MTDSDRTDVDLRRRLRQAIISNLEETLVGGERLKFDRDAGQRWFYENSDQPVFASLKAALVESLDSLRRDGVSERQLLVEVASLRLSLMDAMHASNEPLAVVSEEFRLSGWYRAVKDFMDPAGELSDQEFAQLQVHLLLQEACYMLEAPGFLEGGDSPAPAGPSTGEATGASGGASHSRWASVLAPPQDTVEARLAKVEESNRRLKKGVVLTLVAAVALVVVAFASAEHWTKVDVPEQPETFQTKPVATGKFLVTDDRVSPCSVGQSWNGCIEDMTRQLNRACWGGPGRGEYDTSVFTAITELTKRSLATCRAYEAEIERMKTQSAAYVATTGSYGHLTREPVMQMKSVSNADHRPAVTHEAVCYLGFIGECR